MDDVKSGNEKKSFHINFLQVQVAAPPRPKRSEWNLPVSTCLCCTLPHKRSNSQNCGKKMPQSSCCMYCTVSKLVLVWLHNESHAQSYQVMHKTRCICKIDSQTKGTTRLQRSTVDRLLQKGLGMRLQYYYRSKLEQISSICTVRRQKSW